MSSDMDTDAASSSDAESVISRAQSSRSSSPAGSPARTVPREAYNVLLRENEKNRKEMAALQAQVRELTSIIRDLQRQLASSMAPAPAQAPTPAPARPPSPVPARPPSPGPGKKAAPAPETSKERSQKRKKPEPSNSGSDLEAPSAAKAKKPTPPQTQQATEEPAPKADAAPKIPPVVLRKKERWTQVSALLKAERVNFPGHRWGLPQDGGHPAEPEGGVPHVLPLRRPSPKGGSQGTTRWSD